MAEFVLIRSTAPLRRHAETKPVTIPTAIARNVPTNTIGIVFFNFVGQGRGHGLGVGERHAQVRVEEEFLQVERVLLPQRLVQTELVREFARAEPARRAERGRTPTPRCRGARGTG